MARIESRHERIAECIRWRLRTILPADGFVYLPSRVARTIEFPDHWFRESGYTTMYFVSPGRETVEEDAGKKLIFNAEISIVGARRFVPSVEDPLVGYERIVEPAAFANGPLAIAAQPAEPSQLLFLVTTETATAGTITVNGTDEVGSPVSFVYDLALYGREVTGFGCFASVSSATVAGVVGAGVGDVVTINAGSSRWQASNRMAGDIIKRVSGAGGFACAGLDQVINVEVSDVDRDLKMEGWALVKVDLLVEYESLRTEP